MDGLEQIHVTQLDEYIAELRDVLLGAAGRPSPALTEQFRKAKEKADEEERSLCAA